LSESGRYFCQSLIYPHPLFLIIPVPIYNPADVPHREFHQILLSGVAPRPIAFVSTQDSNGNTNLAPYSFFNAYASKPPVVAIGPAVSAATGKTKDTWRNIMETGECTINAVTYSMVEQMNLASTDYEPNVDEFVKAGFTKKASSIVKPPMVAESPFSMECTLIKNIELFREEGGNGNIMLLRVQQLHVSDSIIRDGAIDPKSVDFVARMGYKWYARITPDVCFELGQPRIKGIGFDNLPNEIKSSPILTGSDLAILAGVDSIPPKNQDFIDSLQTQSGDSEHDILRELSNNRAEFAMSIYVHYNFSSEILLHKIAQCYLRNHQTLSAWQVLQYP
jgi:flavin reductase (DIM6/NTAB) family NADH-FMN oxidoreductase RutF